MPFNHKGIEYHIGLISTKFTISRPAIKNYFKEIDTKKIDAVHNIAQSIIEDEIRRISKQEK